MLIGMGWAFGRSLENFIIHGEKSVKSYKVKGNHNDILVVRLRRLPNWGRFMSGYERFSPMTSRNRRNSGMRRCGSSNGYGMSTMTGLEPRDLPDKIYRQLEWEDVNLLYEVETFRRWFAELQQKSMMAWPWLAEWQQTRGYLYRVTSLAISPGRLEAGERQ